jgi:hypothetical protein
MWIESKIMKKIQFSLCLIFIFCKVNVIAADVPALESPCKHSAAQITRSPRHSILVQVSRYRLLLLRLKLRSHIGPCPRGNSEHNRAIASLSEQITNCNYQHYIDFVKISTKMADNLKNASLTYFKIDDALQQLYYKNLDIFVANDCLEANAQCVPPDFHLIPSLFEYRPNAFFCEHENARAKAYHLLHMYEHAQKLNSCKFNHEILPKIEKDCQTALAELKKKYAPLQKQIADAKIQIRRQCKSWEKGQKFSLNTAQIKINSPTNLNLIVNQLPTEKSLNTFNMHVYTDSKQLSNAMKHHKKIYRNKVDYINKEYEKQVSGLAKDIGPLQDRHLNYANSLSRKKNVIISNTKTNANANISLIAENSSIVPIEFKKFDNHKYAFDNFSSWNHGAGDYYGAKRGRCKTPYVLVPEGEKGYLKLNISANPNKQKVKIVEQGEIVKDLLPKDPTIITTNVSFCGNKQGLGNISAQQQSQNVAAAKVYVVKKKNIRILLVNVNNSMKISPNFDCFKKVGINVTPTPINYYDDELPSNPIWPESNLLKLKDFFLNQYGELSDYHYIQFFVPGTADFLGLAQIKGRYSWVLSNAGPRTPPHELGHNMGLHDLGLEDSIDNQDKDALMTQTEHAKYPMGLQSTKFREFQWKILHFSE